MHHHTQLSFGFLVEMGFHHVGQAGQAGLELLTSDDSPASASQSAGITSVSHHAWPMLFSFLSQDTELLDLRETIDFLKKKNSEAQAVIQGALNASETTPKGRTSSHRLRGNRDGRKGRLLQIFIWGHNIPDPISNL